MRGARWKERTWESMLLGRPVRPVSDPPRRARLVDRSRRVGGREDPPAACPRVACDLMAPRPTHVLASLPLALAASLFAQTPPASLGPGFAPKILDGEFDDWADLPTISTSRDERDASEGAPEIGVFSLACDQDSVWMYLEFEKELNLQALETPLTIFVDGDTPSNGARGGYLPGADFVVIFSPTDELRGGAAGGRSGEKKPKSGGQAAGVGAVVRRVNEDGSFGDVVAPSFLGLGMAPAHASRTFELRFDRSATLFAGKSAAARPMCLRARPAATSTPNAPAEPIGNSAAVEILEEVGVTRLLLLPRPRDLPPKAKVEDDAVARPSNDAAPPIAAGVTPLRVASWNAELGALFKTPAPFGATIKALRPDVVLWQELGKDATAESLAAWMNSNVGEDGGTWSAVVSGGDLRTGVVARGNLAVAPFLDGLKRPTEKGERDVRVTGAILEQDGKRVLLASLHLKCCGRLGSSEDETRAAETAAIREALEKASKKLGEAGTPLDGIVVAGDFNLVGSRRPVDAIGESLDFDGSSLDIVPAFDLERRSNATWRSTGNDFLPGRLDWMLVSGSRCAVRKSFVFSAEDLSDAAVAVLGLPASAIKEPSDHQPVVADLAFSASPSVKGGGS